MLPPRLMHTIFFTVTTTTETQMPTCTNRPFYALFASILTSRVSTWMDLRSYMVKSLYLNAVYGKCKGRLTERGNYVSRFQTVVIQAPEAVRLSGARDPWDTWILKHPAIHHFHPMPTSRSNTEHAVLFFIANIVHTWGMGRWVDMQCIRRFFHKLEYIDTKNILNCFNVTGECWISAWTPLVSPNQ